MSFFIDKSCKVCQTLEIKILYVIMDLYLVDKKMGMNNYILLRTDRKKYIWTKGTAIFILVSLTILINILLSISLTTLYRTLYVSSLY